MSVNDDEKEIAEDILRLRAAQMIRFHVEGRRPDGSYKLWGVALRIFNFVAFFSLGFFVVEYVKNYVYRQDRMAGAASFLANCPTNARCCACQSEDCKKYECVGGAADGGMFDGSVGGTDGGTGDGSVITSYNFPIYRNPPFPVRFVSRDDAGLSWCLVGDGGQCTSGWCSCSNPECTRCREEVYGPR